MNHFIAAARSGATATPGSRAQRSLATGLGVVEPFEQQLTGVATTTRWGRRHLLPQRGNEPLLGSVGVEQQHQQTPAGSHQADQRVNECARLPATRGQIGDWCDPIGGEL